MSAPAPAFRSSSFPSSCGVLKWDQLRRQLFRELRFEPALKVDMIRHGETITNATGLVTGAQDVDLSPRGQEQAREAGPRLGERYDLAVSSTLRRSIETLELARNAGGVHIRHKLQDERLRERSLGELELRPAVHIPELAEGDLEYAPRGGESYALVARKCLSFLVDLHGWAESRSAERILLCTHMGPMRILVGILDAENEPASVLERSFKNADVVHRTVSRIGMPAFLLGARG